MLPLHPGSASGSTASLDHFRDQSLPSYSGSGSTVTLDRWRVQSLHRKTSSRILCLPRSVQGQPRPQTEPGFISPFDQSWVHHLHMVPSTPVLPPVLHHSQSLFTTLQPKLRLYSSVRLLKPPLICAHQPCRCGCTDLPNPNPYSPKTRNYCPLDHPRFSF